jgi:uncharacterized protein
VDENVEVVRRIYAAWQRGESAGQWMDRDIEYVNPHDAVEQGVLRGRKSFARVTESFDEVSFEPERFVGAGEKVVVIAKLRGRGRASGIETETVQGYVWTVRDGKAVRFEWFRDPLEAMAAAGLESGELS